MWKILDKNYPCVENRWREQAKSRRRRMGECQHPPETDIHRWCHPVHRMSWNHSNAPRQRIHDPWHDQNVLYRGWRRCAGNDALAIAVNTIVLHVPPVDCQWTVDCRWRPLKDAKQPIDSSSPFDCFYPQWRRGGSLDLTIRN